MERRCFRDSESRRCEWRDRPSANDLITFEVVGSGVVAAVDSGDNADHDAFQDKKRKAFQGICIALVKANKGSGKINITARAAGLRSGKIAIGVGR
jgi:beta-galactosidase